jgi:hypothetical protein
VDVTKKFVDILIGFEKRDLVNNRPSASSENAEQPFVEFNRKADGSYKAKTLIPEWI